MTAIYRISILFFLLANLHTSSSVLQYTPPSLCYFILMYFVLFYIILFTYVSFLFKKALFGFNWYFSVGFKVPSIFIFGKIIKLFKQQQKLLWQRSFDLYYCFSMQICSRLGASSGLDVSHLKVNVLSPSFHREFCLFSYFGCPNPVLYCSQGVPSYWLYLTYT